MYGRIIGAHGKFAPSPVMIVGRMINSIRRVREHKVHLRQVGEDVPAVAVVYGDAGFGVVGGHFFTSHSFLHLLHLSGLTIAHVPAG